MEVMTDSHWAWCDRTELTQLEAALIGRLHWLPNGKLRRVVLTMLSEVRGEIVLRGHLISDVGVP